jgi:hypothetical protein
LNPELTVYRKTTTSIKALIILHSRLDIKEQGAKKNCTHSFSRTLQMAPFSL